MTLWSVLDPIESNMLREFEPTHDPPQYRIREFCQSNALSIWLSVILYGVNGFTVLAVVVLAIITRKVHLECFKDTKHVNMFVYSTVLCLCTWIPYLYVITLNAKNRVAVASYIISIYPYFVIPFLCKLFLFLPRIWSSRHEKRRRSMKKKASIFTFLYCKKKQSHGFMKQSLQIFSR